MTSLVIGLGSMGLGAAASLLRAGLPVVGMDLNSTARDKFSALGGTSTDSLADVNQISTAFIFVVNAKQAETVIFETGLLDKLAPNATVINCVTLAPSIAIDIAARVNARGFGYLDAPVSGGAAKAMSGEMSIMASGAPEAFERTQTVLDAISAKVFTLGDQAGNGSKMKLVNQLLAGVHIAAAAESLNLAAKMDMDLHEVIDVISHCAGTSWMFENRGPHIADGDYSPLSTVDIFVKDMGIVTGEAAHIGATTPLSDAAQSLYQAASNIGLGQEDDSAVVKLLAQQSNTTLPGSGQ